MNLRGQLLAIVILPILVVFSFSLYVHIKSWERFESQVQERSNSRSEEFKASFAMRQNISDAVGQALASNFHVRKAMETDDLDSLFNISSGFRDIEFLRIIFIDLENRVLLRNYDELRFGDILGFSPTKIGPQLISVDNKLSIGSLLPIKLDEVDLVGHVLVVFPLDKEGLQKLTKSINPNVGLSVNHENWYSESIDQSNRKNWTETKNEITFGSDKLEFTVFENFLTETRLVEDTVAMEVVQNLTLILLIVIAITFFLRRQVFTPINKLLKEVRKYGTEEKPEFYVSTSSSELYKVSEALQTIHDDLEEKKRKEAKLRDELIKDKEKLKRDNTLLQVLCHDLGTPLFVLKGAAHLLFDKLGLSKAEEELKTKMFRSINATEAIIRHVKDMMTIQSGKAVLTLEDVSLTSFVDNARFLFEEKLAEKNIQLLYEVTDKYIFRAEHTTFSNNVFNNIISNAIKFSPVDSNIMIRERLEGSRLIIEIEDQGVGIPDRIVKHLFAADKKTTTLGVNGETGTGFGMPVAHAYMEYFGGSIEVSTRTKEDYPNNSGTTFRLVLAGRLSQV